MLRSRASDLYDQIEKLTQQVRTIEAEEAKNFKEMKAIIQFKSSMLGWSKSINKIYFDTMGYFSGLKEAELKSNCAVYSGPEEVDLLIRDYTIMINGDRYIGNIYKPYASEYQYTIAKCHIKQCICLVTDKYNNKIIYIALVNDNLYAIQWNPYRLDYDMAMDISHKVICFYYTRGD